MESLLVLTLFIIVLISSSAARKISQRMGAKKRADQQPPAIRETGVNASMSPIASEDAAAQLKAANQQLEREAGQKAAFAAQLLEARAEADATAQEYASLRQLLEGARKDNQQSDRQIAELVAQLNAARRDVKNLDRQVQDLRAKLAESQSTAEAGAQKSAAMTMANIQTRRPNPQPALSQPRLIAPAISRGSDSVAAQLEGARRDLRRYASELGKLETELKRARQHDAMRAERMADLEAQLQEAKAALSRESAQRDELEAHLARRTRDADALGRDKMQLEERLKQARQASSIDPKDYAAMERALEEERKERELAEQRNAQLESRWQAAEARANQAEYKHLVKSAINTALKAANLIKAARGISPAEMKRNRPRATKTINEADRWTSIFRQQLGEAITAASQANNGDGCQRATGASVRLAIDADIRDTGFTSASIIEAGHQIRQ